jgi:hypothetical protein
MLRDIAAWWQTLWRGSLWLCCSLLVACGGGGGTGGTGGTPSVGADSTHGALSLGISGGAYRDVQHVWITVGTVALHAQANQAWSAGDSTWKVLRLSTPVVVDLAVLPSGSQGDVTRVLSGLSVPAGTYAQIRLFPMAHDVPLDDAAAAKGLSYNAQVDYTDNQGTARVVPLEWPQPDQGWRVGGTFTVSANAASYVVLQSDLLEGLVRLSSADGIDHFTFRPRLQAYDMTANGAVIGVLDASRLCGGASAAAAPACAQDVVVSAQRLSADGTRYESVRQYRVSSSTGGFALYPLPSGASYDVVITGRRMQTMVIRGVTVAPFSVLDTLAWTSLGSSSAPLQPTLTSATGRTVNPTSPLSPASAQLVFGQTLAPQGRPHVVAVSNVDVRTGLLARDLDLPQGPVSVADFVSSDAALSFSDVTPQEGAQAFTVRAWGAVYDDPGSASVVTPPLGQASTVSVSAPVRQAGMGAGQIQVTLQGALSARYDTATLVVSDVNGVVLTQPASPGVVTLTVPAGSLAAASGAGAVYSVALRAAGPGGALRWVRAASTLDLRQASSANVSLTLP